MTNYNSIPAAKAVFWLHYKTKQVRVARIDPDHTPSRPEWVDPIGAHYVSWRNLKRGDRTQLMLETAMEFMADGCEPRQVLSEFAKVDEFFALGRESYPMCRALTLALVGQSLNPETMTFDELLVRYKPKDEYDFG